MAYYGLNKHSECLKGKTKGNLRKPCLNCACVCVCLSVCIGVCVCAPVFISFLNSSQYKLNTSIHAWELNTYIYIIVLYYFIIFYTYTARYILQGVPEMEVPPNHPFLIGFSMFLGSPNWMKTYGNPISVYHRASSNRGLFRWLSSPDGKDWKRKSRSN